MVKTLVNDPFEDDEVKEPKISFEPHNIVYGTKGFTDALDDKIIALLVEVGIISFVRAIDHEVCETRIYVSREGNHPTATA